MVANLGGKWTEIQRRFRRDCERTNAQCWLCREAIDYTLRGTHPDAFSADHVTPRSLGGDPYRTSNLKPAHIRCNTGRGNTTRGTFPTSRQW